MEWNRRMEIREDARAMLKKLKVLEDEEKIRNLEKKFQTKKRMAEYLGMTYSYVRRYLKGAKIFSKREKEVQCFRCGTTRIIRFQRIDTVDKYLARVQKPFCSRKCYSAHLKEHFNKLKAKMDTFYASHPPSEWPNVYFGWTPYWWRSSLVVHQYVKEQYEKEGAPLEESVKFLSKYFTWSKSRIHNLLEAGMDLVARHKYNFQPRSPEDLKNRFYLQKRGGYLSPDGAYIKSIWSFVANL